ncbi:hypothetical protein S40285_10713 [Stachybotrys chlorohalonatus IBT 40285]|uniref:Uncharacterized protein n=1 Tax=Stachybotrys chlorohalonatus (strain IBT 40285) TaxID=1283841 RepID=A0A084QVP5_STAC4|nr:hypothetical protein S40285_10713 [Stachybotrys chlorohalonata IBT 40285]
MEPQQPRTTQFPPAIRLLNPEGEERDIPREGNTIHVWKIPGLDKTSFYASALYLHAAAKGQLRDTEQHGQHHEPTTEPHFRDFLDRLADCFAGSKGNDAAAHVSATGMVLDKTARRITIYVAKNASDKKIRTASPPQQRNDSVEGEQGRAVRAATLRSVQQAITRGQGRRNRTATGGSNKRLQDFAAATAASITKAMLEQYPKGDPAGALLRDASKT